MKSHVRAFAVEVTGEAGEKEVVLQIEIACEVCGPTRYVIAGHHLHTLRDVIIDHLDQFPYLAGTTTKTSTHAMTLGGALSQKPETN